MRSHRDALSENVEYDRLFRYHLGNLPTLSMSTLVRYTVPAGRTRRGSLTGNASCLQLKPANPFASMWFNAIHANFSRCISQTN